ncbi:MAG: FG-GAP-like repeat-containing protein [Terriglobales bacterium]
MSRVRSCGVALFVVAMAGVISGCGSSSPPISVSLSPSSAQAIDQSQTVVVTATVTNDPASRGVAWTLTGPGSLSNPTGPAVTYNSPTTSISSAEQATVTATSVADQTKTASLQITVNPYPQIPIQQSLPNGLVSTPYSQMIMLTGGTPPFQWSVYDGPIETGYEVGGSVPDGLQMNAATGAVSGTPTGGGTWYFAATATDAAGVTAFDGFLSIQIMPTGAAGNAVPFLNQPLEPTAVSPGTLEFTLSVSGTGFVSGATVNFNRTALATTFVDRAHLTATVPASEVASAGTASITVVNPGPGGGASNVVFLQVGAPESTVVFAPAANSPLQVYAPFGIAVGDFNEDGKADLAIAGGVKLFAFLGNGDGTFTPAAGSPMEVPSPPYDNFASPYLTSVIAADLNHSGHLGLATGLLENEAAVILLGKGDGTFAPSSAAFANGYGLPLYTLGTADFNSDGNLDLAIINGVGDQLPVDLGYGDGAFSTAGYLDNNTAFAEGMAVGDFNADGKLDLAVANSGVLNYSASGVSVSLGKGDGTFTPASGSPIAAGQSLYAVVAADFNGDGKVDLAATDSFGNAVVILLGNGDGTFGVPSTIKVGNNPDAIVAGDFNNDGKLDLATANYGDGTITLLLGNGDGTFTQAAGSPYSVGQYPYQIVAADFNGDGKLDLATTNLGDGTVSILLQQ